MSKPEPVDDQSADSRPNRHDSIVLQEQLTHSVPPCEFVYQLILEQFWGDGVSKREIRSVFTTASDANAACQDYLLWSWPRSQFELYEIGSSPQTPEFTKVSALINGDRFHVWIERHSWEGTLDFTSKAIAKRAGKGPNAYILQRTIKDASGDKRRSTTRGIFATRHLAKLALAHDAPPSGWSSNQGYVLEPGGEYAHALSPSGKTAWLFIEVRPLYMSYTRLEQELQDAAVAHGSPSHHLGVSALNPISLDYGDDSTPTTASLTGTQVLANHSRFSLDDPFSPIPSNPDEAGALVYLVMQLKTIPYTPPILTVEAVAYEIEVANRFGIALLEDFIASGAMFEPAFRADGCLQSSVEQRARDEGLTVWVEKRAVVLGDDNVDSDIVSKHRSVQLNKAHTDALEIGAVVGPAMFGSQKRVEPEDGFEPEERPAAARSKTQPKAVRMSLSDTSDDLTTTTELVDLGEDSRWCQCLGRKLQE
ncbi:hypothetical protein BGZ98_000130 [Dissophora globulifera]|nr:hypothetical protein BGZ98_000130 [Dissophora globulifera]